MMDILKATQEYEALAEARTRFLRDVLELKHQRMAESAFLFFRATFYRWAQLWPEACSDLAEAPVVLAVGGTHVENFATLRAADLLVAAGVSDCDEDCA